MFEKVLFPTDFSEYAQKTLECAGDIPGIKEVVLLHIVDAVRPSRMGWTHNAQIENAKILLGEKKEYLESLGLKVQVKVEVITRGDVSREILDTAGNEDVSLIVMGARGKSLIRDIVLGSVSANVLRGTKVPLLIMRYELSGGVAEKQFRPFCPRIFSKVLLPVDFSRPADDAVSFVKNIRGIEEIVIMHVVDRGETREEIGEEVRRAKEILTSARDTLVKEGLTVTCHVRIGDPSREIISVAESDDVSVIAMSTSGKGLVSELLVGSTTFAVARTANRPVLVVRGR
jgi:nucleotide-binding universal stress UspA family protein